MKLFNNQKNSKTRFYAYLAVSIDGRISVDSKSFPDWTSIEDWNFLQKELSRMDAVVAGRTTYEIAKERMDKRNTFVFTTRVETTERFGSLTFVNPNNSNLKEIFSKYNKVGIVGGASVYQKMLDEGLIDDLYITIEPYVFGRGREAFMGGTKNFKFNLKSVKKLNKQGTLLIHYKNANTRN